MSSKIEIVGVGDYDFEGVIWRNSLADIRFPDFPEAHP